MIVKDSRPSRSIIFLFLATVCFTLTSTHALATGYDNALKGIKSYDAVFEVTQANPKVANIVFWAVKNSYEASEVKDLAKDPNIVVVFHGPAVKMLSTDRSHFNGADWAEVEKFQTTLRQMKQDGVKLEICLYAAKGMGVGKDTIIPEIDHVGNGFVSVIGYQMQGYGVVRIP